LRQAPARPIAGMISIKTLRQTLAAY
jgi:hypothetical protein